jgi:ArsR family transcriptional regulator
MDARLDQLLKAAGEPTRLRILDLLSQGPACVCELQATLGLPQPTVSRHLAYLRGVGMVVCERRGPRIVYSIVSPTTRPMRALLNLLETING